jgi:hypothetical protein
MVLRDHKEQSMPRPSSANSIDAILRDTAERVVSRVSAAIARQVGDLVQERLQRELGRGRGEIRRWVADTRARRVPTFVIEATGLDTKKKIVSKYGPGAAFEKGKALPRAKG